MQLTYSQNMPRSLPGRLFDLSLKNIETGYVEGEEKIELGSGLIYGTKEGQVKLPDADITNFAGIALHQVKEMSLDGLFRYEKGDAIPVLTFGKVWVPVIGEVTAGSDVYLIYGGTDGNKGKFIAASSDANTATKITNATFKTATLSADGLAVVELK